MRTARTSIAASLLGTIAGALLGAALVGGPVAHADDIATLPVPAPPFNDQFQDQLSTPGTAGLRMPDGDGVNTGTYSVFYDQQPYTTTDGNYVVQDVTTSYNPFYNDLSQQVISSVGVAPAVGTTWDESGFDVPVGLGTFDVFHNSQLTTADGTEDLFVGPFGYENIYYQGPAGTIDYLSSGPNDTFIPIIDIPAAGDTAAAINPADLAGLGDVTSLATLATDIQSLF